MDEPSYSNPTAGKLQSGLFGSYNFTVGFASDGGHKKGGTYFFLNDVVGLFRKQKTDLSFFPFRFSVNLRTKISQSLNKSYPEFHAIAMSGALKDTDKTQCCSY